MNKTAIEWCDQTWNPITGCFHACPYCYAAKIAHRYGLKFAPRLGDPGMDGACKYDTELKYGGMDSMLELQKPYVDIEGRRNSYPMGFAPTFHRYRLDEPQHIKKPQNIFVCSMADLFGEWVPDEWIEAVFDACERAPWHKYLFLTKNPKRYEKYINRYMPNNMWFGWTQTKPCGLEFKTHHAWQTFLSLEPIQAEFPCPNPQFDWLIIGAETGNRKGKIIPKREWIENIVRECRLRGVPVFMKDSLKEIWGKPLIREYPWEEAQID
jgi:protein gp37